MSRHPEYSASDLKAVDRGLSAFTGEHRTAGLGALLEAIQAGQISAGDAIVVEAIDRITREDASSALHCITGIVNAGVKIYTVEDDACYDAHSLQSTSLYVLVAKIHASHEHSKRLSQRVSAAYENKKRKAKLGDYVNAPNRPFWIDVNGRLLPKESEIARKLISLYIDGEGQLALLKSLRMLFGDQPPVPRTTRSVKRILTTEALIGYWQGMPAYQPLITVSEYMQLADLVRQRTVHSKPEEQYLLSGLIKCGHCGSSYNFRRQKPRATEKAPLGSKEYEAKGDIVYANCSNFLKTGKCVNSFTVPYEVAELAFERTVFDVLYSLAAAIAVDALTAKALGELLAKKQLLMQRIERLSNLYRITGIQSDLDQISDLKKELDGVSAALEREENKNLKAQRLQLSREIQDSDFEEGTPEQQEFNRQIQAGIYKLTGSVLNYRTALKDYGYQIIAERNSDGKNNGRLKVRGNTYSISRRSQKLGCYIVNAVEQDGIDEVTHLELQARRKQRT